MGDRTRLRLLGALAAGSPLSIARLTEGSMLTRQAVTKHLRVLRDARLVRSVRRGREMRFELSGAALDRARRTLTAISWRWDEALARLNAHVER